jgi:hypothetical protein
VSGDGKDRSTVLTSSEKPAMLYGVDEGEEESVHEALSFRSRSEFHRLSPCGKCFRECFRFGTLSPIKMGRA